MDELLKKKFGSLIANEIPRFEKIQKSLISILKAHSETNLSNLLCYFFAGEEHRLLKEIFVESIVLPLEKDGPEFIMDIIEDGYNGLEVYNEYTTKAGNRIDIVLKFEHEKPERRFAIIIENKLYHHLNNDLEDYFYSVCEEENVLPKNALVLVLSLKDINDQLPNNIPIGFLTHKNMKSQVSKSLNSYENLLNDRSISLITNEYIRHINDLYLESSSLDNQKCIEFYNTYKKEVNEFVDYYKYLKTDQFRELSEENKLFLFENKAKLDAIVTLHSNVLKVAKESFNHFLEITNRKAKGDGSLHYFRGKESSYDAIRYQLEFNKYFTTEQDYVTLKVFLNNKYLSDLSINLDDKRILSLLERKKASISQRDSKNSWVQIIEQELFPDETLLNNIFKNDISQNWEDLENLLIAEVNSKYVLLFERTMREILRERGFTLENKQDNSFVFYSVNNRFIQFHLKYLPLDYVEITLHAHSESWEDVSNLFDKMEGYLIFTRMQSFRIPEISDEINFDTKINYDALLKRSYRIKSMDDLKLLMEKELIKWNEIEEKIMKAINEQEQD